MKPLKPIPEKKQIEGRKHLVIAVLLVCVSAAFWYNVHSFLVNGLQFTQGRISQLVGTLLLFGLMTGLVGIVGFSFRHFNTRLIVYFLGLAPHFLFFGFTYYSIVAVVLLWLFWVRYGRNTDWEEKERVHFHTIKILTHTLGTVLTFSVFALAFTYYGVVVQDGSRSERLIDRLAQTATDAALNVFESTVEDPNFDPDMNVNAFLERFAGENTKELFPTKLLPENLNTLLEEGQPEQTEAPQPLSAAELAEFYEIARSEFGIEITGEETLRDVVSTIVGNRVQHLLEPYRTFIPPILAGSLFLALSAFSLLYFWCTVCMGWLMTKILFWVRILRIVQQTGPIDQLIVE